MSELDFLLQRRSVPSRLLSAPGPDAATIDALLSAAMRIPDHGKLDPFRLLLIEGDARLRLGDFLAERTLSRQPVVDPAAVAKDRGRFANAPLIVTVIACVTSGHKVPEQEQLLSAGAVCHNLLLGAQALGFGAQWLTGWAAYDAEVATHLGLMANERIVGFIHIGSSNTTAPERQRPTIAEKTTRWAG